MKPVELIERALANSSKAGDLVVDSFGGSGSTLIACERRNRKARIMELDHGYTDVIVRRWQDLTGKIAVLEGDGGTFDEVARARLATSAEVQISSQQYARMGNHDGEGEVTAGA